MKKKVIIFLPDGVGLRNFVFTKFYNKISQDFEVVFWNNTSMDLTKKFNFKEILFQEYGTHFLTNILKVAKKNIELKINARNSKNEAYLSYIFHTKSNNLKDLAKKGVIYFLTTFYCSYKGLHKIDGIITKLEKKTKSYKYSIDFLKKIKPDFLFCTSQRSSLAIAPTLAAKSLGIPTGCFIYSWDNLPKATMVVNADYNFVWSDYMKHELLKYYPSVEESKIKVTGTPQFEPHFYSELIMSKEEFYNSYNLDHNKKYICFSGDDITTSPFDQYYLEDLAKEVEIINNNFGGNLGIIYRKCPVDFTGRHKEIIEKYKDTIVTIDPLWENLGNTWNQVMPKKDDLKLLANTVKHSILIVNVGSSMVFDGIIHNTPCAYLNYNVEKGDVNIWDINKIYKYIHFQSMSSKKEVQWINEKEDYRRIIDKAINGDLDLEFARKWFNKIVLYPQHKSSERIINEIKSIVE